MAILSGILGLLFKEMGTLLQALFGWSVTALFGRLSTKKQIAVSAALLLSIVWPVFVVGIFFPAAAAWVVAFLPMQHWIGRSALRVMWIVFAVLTPAIVGVITHVVAPLKKGGIFRAMLMGYPLAIGYAASFLITAVTVPVIKAMSLIRGFSDDHVYVQPRPERYGMVVNTLVDACKLAGLTPTVSNVPLSMALSTKVLKTLSRGAVAPIVSTEPKMIRAQGVELYLYAADLLIRGKPDKVAHVRAMMTRTMLERDALLVSDPLAQKLQDELGKMWESLTTTPDGTQPLQKTQGIEDRVDARQMIQRAKDVSKKLDTSDIPFDDWVMLERILQRIQMHILRATNGRAEFEARTTDAITLRSVGERRDRNASRSSVRTTHS